MALWEGGGIYSPSPPLNPLQILAKPNHRFNTSSLYKDVVLLAWDPAPYTVNLHKVSPPQRSALYYPYTTINTQL